MGGYGSGRTGGKPIAEQCRQIDLCRMFREGTARDGQFSSGILHWSCRGQPLGSISYFFDLIDPNDARLTLKFALGSRDSDKQIVQVIPLRFTVPHFGGRRWWMICPVDHTTVSKLYMPLNAQRFAGRGAWHLGYRSQRVAPTNQPLERLFRVRAKVGLERGCNDPLLRPQGMWRRTFARHRTTHDRLNEQVGECLITPAMRAAMS